MVGWLNEPENVEKFAKEVVTNAFEQAVEITMRLSRSDSAWLNVTQDGSDSTSERDYLIAVAAAESALSAFFSNLQLTGLAEIMLLDENGQETKLEDELGAPPFAMFAGEGWLIEHSELHRDALQAWTESFSK